MVTGETEFREDDQVFFIGSGFFDFFNMKRDVLLDISQSGTELYGSDFHDDNIS